MIHVLHRDVLSQIMVVSSLLRLMLLEQPDSGMTPLLLACKLGHERTVKALLAKGANVLAVDVRIAHVLSTLAARISATVS